MGLTDLPDTLLNRFEAGITACRHAIALEADGAVPHMNLGFLLLTLGAAPGGAATAGVGAGPTRG